MDAEVGRRLWQIFLIFDCGTWKVFICLYIFLLTICLLWSVSWISITVENNISECMIFANNFSTSLKIAEFTELLEPCKIASYSAVNLKQFFHIFLPLTLKMWKQCCWQWHKIKEIERRPGLSRWTGDKCCAETFPHTFSSVLITWREGQLCFRLYCRWI